MGFLGSDFIGFKSCIYIGPTSINSILNEMHGEIAILGDQKSQLKQFWNIWNLENRYMHFDVPSADVQLGAFEPHYELILSKIEKQVVCDE